MSQRTHTAYKKMIKAKARAKRWGGKSEVEEAQRTERDWYKTQLADMKAEYEQRLWNRGN